MKTADYDFFLPEDLIASRPVEKRDTSKLLVMHRSGEVEHRKFLELPCLLNPGDMIILNNTRVFPARLTGFRPDGSTLEILLVSENSDTGWNIMTKGRYTGPVTITENFTAYIKSGKTAYFDKNVRDLIWDIGKMPLPPYIKRTPDRSDMERYQTVYAEIEGSIAAPTAGLHFTDELFEKLRSKGVHIRTITLHVGTGTFRPVKSVNVEDHIMESEYFDISPGLLKEIHHIKASGRRIISVGTTTTRAMEGYASGDCRLTTPNGSIRGRTGIFIREGYRLRVIDSLITNFHLPCSTPLMLAAVFSGRENLLSVYKTAISMGYRFFSYGDAMLFL